ncbi:MAG: YsnF/AvaK domain-containing protein [Leptolyngbya sp. IPPAS B-1204]
MADKTRRKTGEVAIGKHVETETQHVSVPVEKERVVIERVNPTDTDVASTVGTGAFQEGEVVRMEVYEETPDIRKEAFVREEVRVRKEVDRDTVETDETIRKERLDIDKDGNPLTRE